MKYRKTKKIGLKVGVIQKDVVASFISDTCYWKVDELDGKCILYNRDGMYMIPKEEFLLNKNIERRKVDSDYINALGLEKLMLTYMVRNAPGSNRTVALYNKRADTYVYVNELNLRKYFYDYKDDEYEFWGSNPKEPIAVTLDGEIIAVLAPYEPKKFKNLKRMWD